MNLIDKPPIICRVCNFSCDKGCPFEQVDYKTRRGVCKSCAAKRVIDCHHSASGIGDAICAVYAAAGAAATGRRIRLHSKQGHWLSRASFSGLEIIATDKHIGIDLYAGYGKSLEAGSCRKQWYADNLARGAGIGRFAPVAPRVDLAVREKRIGSDNYALLFPFSAWRGREWPAVHWARLTHLLADSGFEVIALDSIGDGARLEAALGGTPAKWFWGMGPEWVTDAMLSAEVVVGNDSGMTHLAGMLGVKTIAIHAQVTAEQLWNKTGVLSVMPDLNCTGCNWQSTRGWRHSCDSSCSALFTVSPEKVYDKISPIK